jgi:hypothetical protein
MLLNVQLRISRYRAQKIARLRHFELKVVLIGSHFSPFSKASFVISRATVQVPLASFYTIVGTRVVYLRQRPVLVLANVLLW